MKIKILYLLLLLNSLISCQNKMEKYDWIPTESSPELYPMNIYQGFLFLEDGNSLYIPCSASSHTGWGYSGSTHTQGDDLKAVPVKLQVTWASFCENKFYTGSWDLPVNKIKELFKAGTVNWRTNKKETYSSVRVGLAPGGVVVVWMFGNGNQVEIGRYQAKETTVAMKDFVPGNPTVTQNDFFAQLRKLDDPALEMEYEKKGIQFGIWDTYRKKYDWRTKIEIPNHSLNRIAMEMFNGEAEVLINDAVKVNALKKRAVPRFLSYLIEDSKGEETVFDLRYFDEEEIFKIFNQLDDQKPIEIIIKMDEDLTNRQVIVLQNGKQYFIKKIDTDNIFKNEKYKSKVIDNKENFDEYK